MSKEDVVAIPTEKEIHKLLAMMDSYGYDPDVKGSNYGSFRAKIRKGGFVITDRKRRYITLSRKQAGDMCRILQDCFYTWNQKYAILKEKG